MSDFIIKNKEDYYNKLRNVTEKENWEEWILYMLEMISYTAKKGMKLLKEVTKLMQDFSEEVKVELPKVYSKDLIEILFKLPYTKRQFLINADLGTAKTVGNYLNELEDAGFLTSEKMGKEKLYLNFRLMNVLKNPE